MTNQENVHRFWLAVCMKSASIRAQVSRGIYLRLRCVYVVSYLCSVVT